MFCSEVMIFMLFGGTTVHFFSMTLLTLMLVSGVLT